MSIHIVEQHIKNSRDLVKSLSATPEQKKSWLANIKYLENFSKEMRIWHRTVA
nr:MAG TPA: hypothetical protein [Caudoviricetes sp.]